jgi:choline dehydrogenase-like flavoprotein
LNAVLLEAGPRGPRVGDAPPSDPGLWAYRQGRGVAALDWRRIHAVGGRSVEWGGFSFRFPQSVFEDGGWPYGARTLTPDYAAAEAWLGVVEGRLHPHHRRADRRLGWRLLPLRGARLGQRPWMARDAAGARAAPPRHVALAFDWSGGSAAALRVAGPDGRERRMRARCFVLAAGPVESARLLLASGLGRAIPRVGRGLVSHPTVGYMLVEPRPSLLPLSPHAFLDGGLAPFERQGFSLELLGPQPVSQPLRAELQKLGLSAGEAAQARVTYINGISESTPNERCRVTLSRRETDSLGRPLPVVYLATSAADRPRRARMKASCVALAEAMAEPGAELFLLRDPPASRYLFHEAGTCAMGRSVDAPCDPHGSLARHRQRLDRRRQRVPVCRRPASHLDRSCPRAARCARRQAPSDAGLSALSRA